MASGFKVVKNINEINDLEGYCLCQMLHIVNFDKFRGRLRGLFL